MTTRHFLKVLAGLPAAMLAIPAAKAKPSGTSWPPQGDYAWKGTHDAMTVWEESLYHPMSDTAYWQARGIHWTELNPNGITVLDPT